MSCLEPQISETTATEFQNYLLSKKDNIKWFYWHLKSNLKDFKTYKLIDKNESIGVFCVENERLLIADLYIDEKYRRLGYGKFIIQYISTAFNDIQFKVNTSNNNSINFFDFLLGEKIIISKEHKSGSCNYKY